MKFEVCNKWSKTLSVLIALIANTPDLLYRESLQPPFAANTAQTGKRHFMMMTLLFYQSLKLPQFWLFINTRIALYLGVFSKQMMYSWLLIFYLRISTSCRWATQVFTEWARALVRAWIANYANTPSPDLRALQPWSKVFTLSQWWLDMMTESLSGILLKAGL